jgi:hypothetical protein
MTRPAVALLALLALVGCGGGAKDDRLTLTTPKETSTPGAEKTATPAAPRKKRKPKPVTRAEETTIRGWADALRHGHVDRAASFWAVPAVYSNGAGLLKLTSADDVRQANAELPCGAKVESTRRDPNDRDFVVTTFVLTERPGPGTCGQATGQRARTTFLIRHHKIVEWLRLPDPPEENADPGTAS